MPATPSSPGSRRARLLALAREVLAETDGTAAEFTVTIRSAGSSLTFHATPRDFCPFEMPEMHEAVYLVCTDEPQSVRTIARLSSYANSSRLRAVLSELCQPPYSLLVNSNGGYCRAPVTGERAN